MAKHLWPLGHHHHHEYMDTDNFLRNCRKIIENKYYNTIVWRCQPGRVPFNYITHYYPVEGISEEITASGEFTEDGIELNPSFCSFRFPDDYIQKHKKHRHSGHHIKEGVRLVKLFYRINDGKWMELSPNLKTVSFDLSNNGDKVEIKATYQVWTMGNPHCPIPFLWLGDKDGRYNDDKNFFTDAVPVNPGRKHSGMLNHCDGKDYNADWQLQHVSWYAPTSTKLESNWSYLNAEEFKQESFNKISMRLSTWSDLRNCQIFDDRYMDREPNFFDYTHCYGWKYNYPSYNTRDKESGWWRSAHKSRKSLWWVYEKTFTDSYVASGIEAPAVDVDVTDAVLKVTQEDIGKSYGPYTTRWLNGTKGKLSIEFSGPKTAFADIYAVQKVYSEEIVTKIISGAAVIGDAKNEIEIDLSDYPQLYRSNSVAYYMEIFTITDGYLKYKYKPEDISYTGLIEQGVHYYNDEPPWVPNTKIEKVNTYSQLLEDYSDLGVDYLQRAIDRDELYQISWDAPKDPDGDIVNYAILLDEGDIGNAVFTPALQYAFSHDKEDDWVIRFRQTNELKENVAHIRSDHTVCKTTYNSAIYFLTPDRLAKDSDGNYIDPLDIWIVPHDGKINDYYYGTKVSLLHTEYNPITIKTQDIKEDTASIELTYKNILDLPANIKIYAFMSTHPFDDSAGEYIGVLYDGQIQTGKTIKSYTIYDKINGEEKLKRGHYIKYAISCEEINQVFNPYAEDAWELATGYHIYNCLPTASTPFLCDKDVEAIYRNKFARIAWNESIDDDKDTVSYYLYIASVNKPEINKQKDSFWVDGVSETRNYYKVINMGTSVPTKDIPYKLDFSEFTREDMLQVWITTKDGKGSSRYLTGKTLDIGISEIVLNKPNIIVSNAKAYNLLGKEAVDGENGLVKVYQSNSHGEDAVVTLHAICKKIDGPNAGDMRMFNNIATWNLKSGEWSPDTKINFNVAFKEQDGTLWSNSYVRYFAVSTTSSGHTSYKKEDIALDQYDKWYGQHVFNEHPVPPIIRTNENQTDLHNSLHTDWSYLIDENFKDLNESTIVKGAYDPTVPKVFY